MNGPASVWRTRYDVLSARLLLGLTLADARGELQPDVHRFLADRYQRLARHWRAAGWARRAAALADKARHHADAAGSEDPPPAVAVGLPRSRPWVPVDARGRVVVAPWRRHTSPASPTRL